VIGGEAVAAAAALAVTAGALVTFGVSARKRDRGATGAAMEAEVRAIMFRAIDEGDLAPSVIQALSAPQQRALEAQARALLPNLRGEDRETIGRVLDRLGAVDAARAQAQSRRALARAQAGEFLGESGSPDAVRDLLRLLEDSDPKVRWAAARGLGRLGHPTAVEPLLASLDGKHVVPVDVVADALFQIRECPVPLLRQGLESPSVPTRTVAVELLGRFQALSAADDVIDLLHNDPSVEVRARAARSLGRMGSPRALQPLLSCVESGPVAMRVQAIWALGEIGAPDALPVLSGALMGPSHHISELAADALAAMGPLGVAVLTDIATGEGSAAGVASRALAARTTLQLSSA
jgi:HEAT repeat protein